MYWIWSSLQSFKKFSWWSFCLFCIFSSLVFTADRMIEGWLLEVMTVSRHWDTSCHKNKNFSVTVLLKNVLLFTRAKLAGRWCVTLHCIYKWLATNTVANIKDAIYLPPSVEQPGGSRVVNGVFLTPSVSTHPVHHPLRPNTIRATFNEACKLQQSSGTTNHRWFLQRARNNALAPLGSSCLSKTTQSNKTSS